MKNKIFLVVVSMLFASFSLSTDECHVSEIEKETEIVLLEEVAYQLEPHGAIERIEPESIVTPSPNPHEYARQQMQTELSEISDIEDEQKWFVAYKEVIYKYTKWIEPPKTIFDVFTEEEVDLILRTVETETFDQDFMSKTHVASVIFNRLKANGEYGDSITEIITTENQFAYWRTKITEDTILAAMYVYEIGDTTDGCVAFRSKSHPEKWYDWTRQFIDDAGHALYK